MPRRSTLPDRTLAHAMIDVPRAALLVSLALVSASPIAAQSSDDATAPLSATETVTIVDARGEAQTTVALLPAGPLFALPPITARLGVEMRVGPLGERHSLVLRQRTVLVGPDNATMAITKAGGGEQLVALSQPPRRSLHGLMVPMDFLERTLGEALGVLFRWNAPLRRLEIDARAQRILQARLLHIRQGPVTTVEISFSEVPRYRVDRHADGLDINLLGDRLVLREPFEPDHADPRIRSIEVDGSRVRIALAEDAVAAEPRLLGSPPRLVIEVFRRRVSGEQEDGERDAAPLGKSKRLRTIVLDPGHGGEETGAISASGLVEKDLTLWFAQALARRLERRLPVRVLLTRERDHDVPLDSRTAFANQHKADLFVSLHLNSWFGQGARGAETYFLSRSASDQRAADAAAFDNQATGSTQGDPELGLELILWDLAQSHHLAESQRFANLVQEELNASLGLTDRGVKQAPFRVLVGAAMPAVVVELGFLSNPDEAARLQDPGYRGELVEALVRAMSRFKMQLDADPEAEPTVVGEPSPAEAEPAGAPS